MLSMGKDTASLIGVAIIGLIVLTVILNRK